MENSLFLHIILVLIGIFCILAAIFNWDWFFNSRQAWICVRLLGRMGARIFYFALGVGIGG